MPTTRLSDGTHARTEHRSDGLIGLGFGNEFGSVYAMVTTDDLLTLAGDLLSYALAIRNLAGTRATPVPPATPSVRVAVGFSPPEAPTIRDAAGNLPDPNERLTLADPASRRILRVGDVVAVKPSRPRKRDGWTGTITGLTVGGEVTVTAPGQCDRTVRVERIGARKQVAR